MKHPRFLTGRDSASSGPPASIGPRSIGSRPSAKKWTNLSRRELQAPPTQWRNRRKKTPGPAVVAGPGVVASHGGM